jgi:peptidoglycan/xylan/chitin deacetylase (PgdA/CDA1 family)
MRIKPSALIRVFGSGYMAGNLPVSKKNRHSLLVLNLISILLIAFLTGCEKQIIETPVPPAPVIALTFDDGPDPVYTGMILNILKEKNVKATFFLIGNKMKKYPKITKRIFDEGHSVGNHTSDHLRMRGKSFKEVITNIALTEKIIDSLCGNTRKLFRPPWGLITQEQKDSLSKKGFKVILWNVDSKDFANQKYSPDMIVDIVRHEAQNNDIILFHDSDHKGKKSRMNTVIALPQIIDILRSRGYVFKMAEDITNNNTVSRTDESLLHE